MSVGRSTIKLNDYQCFTHAHFVPIPKKEVFWEVIGQWCVSFELLQANPPRSELVAPFWGTCLIWKWCIVNAATPKSLINIMEECEGGSIYYKTQCLSMFMNAHFELFLKKEGLWEVIGQWWVSFELLQASPPRSELVAPFWGTCLIWKWRIVNAATPKSLINIMEECERRSIHYKTLWLTMFYTRSLCIVSKKGSFLGGDRSVVGEFRVAPSQPS